MKTITLNNGIEMPMLGIGTFNLSLDQVDVFVHLRMRVMFYQETAKTYCALLQNRTLSAIIVSGI